jgi:hypothetical protein
MNLTRTLTTTATNISLPKIEDAVLPHALRRVKNKNLTKYLSQGWWCFERRKTEKKRETNFCFLYKNKPRKKSQGESSSSTPVKLPTPSPPPKQTNRNDPPNGHTCFIE